MIVLVSLAGYVLLYFLPVNILGNATVILSFIPIILAGWLLGPLEGAAGGIILLAINLFMLKLAGELDVDGMLHWYGLAGMAAGILIGAVTGLLARGYNRVLRELKQRRRSEQAQAESEAKFRSVISLSRDGFVLVDENGSVIEWNWAMEHITGIARLDVVGHTIWDLLYSILPIAKRTPERYQQVKKACIDYLRTGKGVWTGRPSVHEYQHPINGIRTIQTQISAIPSRLGWLSSAIIRDITEETLASQTLEASESNYRRLFTHVLDGVYRSTGDGFFLVVNPALVKMLGYVSDAELKKISLTQDIIPNPSDRSQFARIMEEAGQLQNYEVTLKRKDGQHLNVLINAFVVKDENGEVLYQEGTITDISHQKRVEVAEKEARILAEVLKDTSAVLTSTLNFEEVLDRILLNVAKVVPHESVTLIMNENKRLKVVRSHGMREHGMEDFLRKFNLPLEEMDTLYRMYKTGEPLVIPDVDNDPKWVRWKETNWIQSRLAVPLRIRGENTGFLVLDSPHKNFFTQDQAPRLQAFADQAAVAIENARLYAEVRRLAITDGLTGVHNRSYFEERLAQLDRERSFPVSILVADMDDLKVTNDRFGHAAGDALLKTSVSLLKEAFQPGEFIARIGGDEFAVLQLDPVENAMDQIQRVEELIQTYNQVMKADNVVRISLGIARGAPGVPLGKVLAEADHMMYRNKALKKDVIG